MRRALLLALVPFLASASVAHGDDLSACDGSNVEMTKCIWDRYEAADKELNAMWKQVMATFTRAPDYMPADAARDWQDSLVAAQKAWVTYKEKDCNGAVGYEWYGGTGMGAAVGTCLYEKTRARIDDLRARYLPR